jgi:hypothetical protein
MMNSANTAVSSPVVIPTPQIRKVRSLQSALAQVRVKLREDLLRFRTCCADPRASK